MGHANRKITPIEPFNEGGNSSNLVLGTQKPALKRTKRHSKDKTGVKTGVTYRKRFMTEKVPYKLPTICRCKSGEWYIQFYYEYPDKPGKFKPFKVKDGINRVKDQREKEQAAQKLATDLTYWLEVLNYNPFEEKKDAMKQGAQALAKYSAPQPWTLTQAIAEFRAFIKKQGRAKRTVQTYNNYLYNLEGYLTEFPAKDIQAAKFTEHDLIDFLDTENDELEWSGRTYNNYIDFYVTFFNRCNKLEKKHIRAIQYDFDISGVDYKTDNPQRNKAYTPAVAAAVKKELAKPGYENLRDYIEWIFLSAMRPAEIRGVKIGDIDEVNKQIRIVGKTGDRLIPISTQLNRLIEKRGVLQGGVNQYVFGYAGYISNSNMSRDFFSTKYGEVKRALGLDHNFTCYSWKHTGVLAMIKAGFKDEQIMVLTGHKTKAAFEAYKRDLIIENDHAMKGDVVEF